MVKIEKFLKQNGAIIEVTKAVVKPYVRFLCIVYAVQALRGRISAYFDSWESVSTHNGEHLFVNARSVFSLLDLATMFTKIVRVVWLPYRFPAMDF